MPQADDHLTDGVLIAATLAGDQEQFTQLVRRYEPALFRVAASRLGRDDRAEDVVQETLLCAFKSLHSYDSRFSFRTWLWTILLNQCRRHHKKRARGMIVCAWSEQSERTASPGEWPEQESTEETPAQKLAAKERSELLNAMLDRLPEVQADALRLRFFGGLKYHEIADAMQCSLSTAKNRVRWGLTRMAGFMNQQDMGDSFSAETTCDEDRD